MAVIVKSVNSIPRILATVDGARHRAVSEGTGKIVEHSQRSVPVDTGALKGSVQNVIVDEASETKGTVSYNTNYAIYVELGTSRMAAQPYLHPAYMVGSRVTVKSLLAWLRAV